MSAGARPLACPSCGSTSPFIVKPPCSLDQYDAADWHEPASVEHLDVRPSPTPRPGDQVTTAEALAAYAVEATACVFYGCANPDGPEWSALTEDRRQVWRSRAARFTALAGAGHDRRGR